MARGGINKAVVQTARLALLARGEHPSIDAVRIEMGNTGSKTTIHRYLKELEGSDPKPTGATASLNEELTELVARLAQRLEEQAQAGVHRENGKNRTISPADSLQALALWRSCLDKGKSGQLRRKRLIYRGPLRTSPPDPRATNVDVYSPRAA